MKVIIAGGRDFSNYNLLYSSCKRLLNFPDVEIVSGVARGADSLGEKFAKENNLTLVQFPAKWNLYGKKAGYLRNKEMAIYADTLIAFWDGQSSGTKHMIDLAHSLNLNVTVINY